MKIPVCPIALLALALTTRMEAAEMTLATTPVQAIHIQDLGMDGVLRKVADQTHIVIGFESDVDYAKEKQIDLDFPGGTLAELANQCVSLLPGSSWRIVEKRSIVISVPGVAAQLAQLPIEYPGLVGATRVQAWADLSNRPELNSWLRVTSCKRLEIFMGGESRGDRPSVSIPAGRKTLEQIMEAASSASDRYSWLIVKSSREGQCEITLMLW